MSLSNTTLTIKGVFSREDLENETYRQILIEENKLDFVECDRVENVNSFFVAWLIGLQRQLRQQDLRFELKKSTPSLRQLIELYRLEEILVVC